MDGIPVTRREHDVLRLAAEGRTNREIAGVLGIGADSVKFHLKSVYGRLGVSTRGGACALLERVVPQERVGRSTGRTRMQEKYRELQGQGLSQEQIARALGVRRDSVKRALRRRVETEAEAE